METLGIIGGMGPMATAYLLELIIRMTDARTDQEHLDVVVFNRPRVPDRTAYILDKTKPSPLPVLTGMAQSLEKLGCGVLCAPCVTSHFFFPQLSRSVGVPFLHMVEETAQELRQAGVRKAGILATTGTVRTGLFQRALEAVGIQWEVPDGEGQALVMSLIYDDVKAGRAPDMEKFRRAGGPLFAKGCDSLILGCTELSLIKKDIPLGSGYVDALEVLAKAAVTACGAPLKEEYRRLITE